MLGSGLVPEMGGPLGKSWDHGLVLVKESPWEFPWANEMGDVLDHEKVPALVERWVRRSDILLDVLLGCWLAPA